MRHRTAAVLGSAVLLAGLGVPVAASAQRTASVPLPPAVPRTPEAPPPPPYQGKIDRLAELMGTLAYLRDLCGDGDGPSWRGRMEALMSVEGGTAPARERLAGHFNRGFDGYQLTYRACTPAAETVIARALAEGTRLSDALTTQFGTP